MYVHRTGTCRVEARFTCVKPTILAVIEFVATDILVK